jgi:4-carboxymuconolactone decarboxylase
MHDQVYEKGLEIRREMFGAELTNQHVEGASDFTRPLQDLVTRYCFGEIWGREGLSRKLRSMLTVAVLLSLGRSVEARLHIRGALANGVTKEELQELFLHVAAYAGIPAAVEGFRAASEIFPDFGIQFQDD